MKLSEIVVIKFKHFPQTILASQYFFFFSKSGFETISSHYVIKRTLMTPKEWYVVLLLNLQRNSSKYKYTTICSIYIISIFYFFTVNGTHQEQAS